MPKPKTPLLAVDLVIELADADRNIVLVQRKYSPLGWALPGGFVDIGETVEQAAIREAKEETGLEVTLLKLLGVYSDPQRDPRGHSVSVAFVAKANGEVQGGDDASDAGVFDPFNPPALAFDHMKILADYRVGRATGRTLEL